MVSGDIGLESVALRIFFVIHQPFSKKFRRTKTHRLTAGLLLFNMTGKQRLVTDPEGMPLRGEKAGFGHGRFFLVGREAADVYPPGLT